ncbi:MAG: metallothionein [Geminicoccaceae bacterium]|nr:MAG: metallothionein [Geminicoccaceae bacterium]
MTTTTVTHVKCACSDCVCIVETTKAVTKDGRAYCSDACADHHKTGNGCGHAGCKCHG